MLNQLLTNIHLAEMPSERILHTFLFMESYFGRHSRLLTKSLEAVFFGYKSWCYAKLEALTEKGKKRSFRMPTNL